MGSRWLTPDRLSTFLVVARRECDLLNYLPHVLGICNREPLALNPRFLRRNLDAFLDRRRIVRANLRPDAILQRRDDLAARRVILRVRLKTSIISSGNRIGYPLICTSPSCMMLNKPT